MATTFQTSEQDALQKDLANTLLSKLDIDSKFLNEVVDRALTIASKNININTEKLKQEKETTKPSKETTKSDQNKTEKETNDTSLNLLKQISKNQNQPLNVTNNTFEITNTPRQETTLLDTAARTAVKQELPVTNNKDSATKQETILDRFLKTIEKTTSKLEETVKKVPRPWELTPGTSVGYQMLTGEDEAMTERIRKGLVQFMGRYVTNIKTPVGYDTLGFETVSQNPQQTQNKQIGPIIKNTLETVIKDLGPTLFGMNIQEYAPERDILYREMFDLPPRTTTKELQKIKPKEYTLTEELATPFKINKQFDKGAAAEQYILGGAYLTETPDKKNYQYKDVWDIVSSSEKDEKFESLMKESPIQALLQSVQKLKEGETAQIRKLIAPLLRPATVSGVITKEGMPESSPDINLTENLTKEVSVKLEKTPLFNSITKGIKNLKANKWTEGLKEMSSVIPAFSPIVTLLNMTGKNLPAKAAESAEFTIESLKGNLEKITNPSKKAKTETPKTTSFDSVSNTTQNTNKPQKQNIEESSFATKIAETTKTGISSLVENITPETVPSLEKYFSGKDISLNNDTLANIEKNTNATNNAIGLLSQAIARLAQAFGSKSGTTQPVIIPTPQQPQQQGPSASQVAASNVDPIKAVRSNFLYAT